MREKSQMSKYNEIYNVIYDSMISTRLKKQPRIFLDTLAHKITRVIFTNFFLEDENKTLTDEPNYVEIYSPNEKLLASLKK